MFRSIISGVINEKSIRLFYFILAQVVISITAGSAMFPYCIPMLMEPKQWNIVIRNWWCAMYCQCLSFMFKIIWWWCEFYVHLIKLFILDFIHVKVYSIYFLLCARSVCFSMLVSAVAMVLVLASFPILDSVFANLCIALKCNIWSNIVQDIMRPTLGRYFFVLLHLISQSKIWFQIDRYLCWYPYDPVR